MGRKLLVRRTLSKLRELIEPVLFLMLIRSSLCILLNALSLSVFCGLTRNGKLAQSKAELNTMGSFVS